VAWIRVAESAWGPWLVAGLLLAADVVTAVRHDVLPIRHEVIGVLTVWAGVWAIGNTRRMLGPKLKPGQRIVSDETYRADLRLITEAFAAAHGEHCTIREDEARPGLRAV
jgi:hypothetical protein